MFTPNKHYKTTNIAIVKCTEKGCKFEVACYKNKVADYQQGLETDVEEVLHTVKVFKNVSKGQFADDEALEKCFGTKDHIEVCKIILNKGAGQKTNNERQSQTGKGSREIADIIMKTCVDAKYNKPVPISVIENAMNSIKFVRCMTTPPEQQAEEVISLLGELLPLKSAKMKVEIKIPEGTTEDVKRELMSSLQSIDSNTSTENSINGEIRPSNLRSLKITVSILTNGMGEVKTNE